MRNRTGTRRKEIRVKVLIMSVTAGEGHNSTAKAMRQEFESRGIECVILDTFDYVSPELAKFISEGYLLITEKAKYAYQIGYNLAEKRKNLLKDYSPMGILNMIFTDEIEAYLAGEDFDAVVFTHPFAGMILDMMKKKHKLNIHTVGILTDFTFHPYWENCTRNDYVVIPSRMLKFQGIRKGFREEQLIPLGIPINPKFSVKRTKAEARQALGLPFGEDKKMILVMGGSMGYGNIAETVKRIDSVGVDTDFHMYVVCGNNAEARKEVGALAGEVKHSMTVVGFVDYISTLMDAADCIVTKPGGLTTSESMAKNLPMVIVNPIPGQEQRNTEFLVNNGAAVCASKSCPIEECLYGLLTSEVRLGAMVECVKELAKPESSKNVCSFVVDLMHTPYMESAEEETFRK